jgi:hypothetical protein
MTTITTMTALRHRAQRLQRSSGAAEIVALRGMSGRAKGPPVFFLAAVGKCSLDRSTPGPVTQACG